MPSAFCGREEDERPDAKDHNDERNAQQLDAGVLFYTPGVARCWRRDSIQTDDSCQRPAFTQSEPPPVPRT
jgi:hypothetical protein